MSLEVIPYHSQEAQRLDVLIASYCADSDEYHHITRSQIKKLIQKGYVKVNDEVQRKAGFLVQNEALIKIEFALDESLPLKPYDIELDIVYEDEDILVIAKPSGLTMHPGAGNKHETLVNALVARGVFASDVATSVRPGLVHRLDKDTSGLLVVAKHLEAQNGLIQQFSKRSIDRAYLAFVYTTPRSERYIQKEEEGTISAPVARHPHKHTLMCVSEKGGKEAITHWKLKERMSYGTLLDVRLETGRTHQIRVHMEYKGSPVIGDRSYGNTIQLPSELERAAHAFGRQALHAYKLGFIHPISRHKMAFKQDPPKDMEELLSFFRGYREL